MSKQQALSKCSFLFSVLIVFFSNGWCVEVGWSRSCWFVVLVVECSVFGPGKHHVLWHLCDYYILIALESLHERRHTFITSRYVWRQGQSFCWYAKPSQATLTSFARLIAIHLIIHLKLFILFFHQLIVYGTAQLNQKKHSVIELTKVDSKFWNKRLFLAIHPSHITIP